MRAGRIIGVLIIIQMVAGAIVNFALEAPLFDAPGRWHSGLSRWRS